MFAQQLEPEDWSAVLAHFRLACQEVADLKKGYVAQHLGDGALIYFGFPKANEDDASRAVSAALDLIESLKRSTQKPTLTLRIGIATGRVLVGQDHANGALHEGGAVGSTPNRAQRLQALARPSEVVVDKATYRLLRDQFEVTTLGSVDLKSFDEPVECFRIDAVRTTKPLFGIQAERLSPLIGRLGQIEHLLGAWRAAETGEGRVALITGEPGIGKTRLVSEFVHALGPDVEIITANCSALASSSPLQPFVGAFERLFGLEGLSDVNSRKDRLSSSTLLFHSRVINSHVLYEFFGAQERGEIWASEPTLSRKDQLLDTLQTVLINLSRLKPIVLIIEDLHWSDPTTLELLDRLVATIEELPLLVLATARPEYQTSWFGGACVETLVVNRLSRKQATALASEIAGGQLDERSVLDIVSRSDGVPLFVEELTASAVEARMRPVSETVQRAFDVSPIPATLDASLASRLDRLGVARSVARIASVIGRSFDRDALQALWEGSPTDLDQATRALVSSGLVMQAPSDPDQFTFKHALIEDAAYASLPRTEAQVLHARLVAFWEEQQPMLVRERPDILAYHATRSGQAELGARFAQLAGEWALARYANSEAIALLQQALDFLRSEQPCSERDRREYAILMMLGPAMRATIGHADAATLAVYQRARQLSAHVGTVRERMNVLYGVWGVHYARAEHTAALDWSREAFEVGSECDDIELQILGTRLLGESHWAIGDLDKACQLLEQALALAPDKQDITDLRFSQDHRVAAGTFLAWALAQAGRTDRARLVADAAMRRADLLNHPLTSALSKLCGAYLALLLRDAPAAFQHGQSAVVLCESHGISNFAAWSKFCREWGAFWLTEDDACRIGMRMAISDAERLSAVLFKPLFLAMLGEVECHRGDHAAARSALDDAIELVGKTGERAAEAEIWRLSALCRSRTTCNGAAGVEEDLAKAEAAAKLTGAQLYARRLLDMVDAPWCDPVLGDRHT